MGTTETTFGTRVALGAQLREALEELEQAGAVVRWEMTSDEVQGIRYVVTTPATERLDATSAPLTPGELAEWLNARGFDVYIGKGA